MQRLQSKGLVEAYVSSHVIFKIWPTNKIPKATLQSEPKSKPKSKPRSKPKSKVKARARARAKAKAKAKTKAKAKNVSPLWKLKARASSISPKAKTKVWTAPKPTKGDYITLALLPFSEVEITLLGTPKVMATMTKSTVNGGT